MEIHEGVRVFRKGERVSVDGRKGTVMLDSYLPEWAPPGRNVSIRFDAARPSRYGDWPVTIVQPITD